MSNQIEQIQLLFTKEKKFQIPKEIKGTDKTQATVTIYPLGLDQMSLMNFKEGASINETSEMAKTLFAASLKITEEQAGRLSFEFMEDLLDAVMEANNISADDSKNKNVLKDFIEKKKSLLSKKDDKNINE